MQFFVVYQNYKYKLVYKSSVGRFRRDTMRRRTSAQEEYRKQMKLKASILLRPFYDCENHIQTGQAGGMRAWES